MSQPNVLISGSGIAGSVFAFWLLRAYPKAAITIVERAPALRLTGAAVDIRNSAVDIIKLMGAEQEIRKHSTQEAGISFVRSNGKPIATLRATGKEDVQSITSEFEIFRGALAKIFIEPSLSKGVKLICNESIDHYKQTGDGVLVTFAKSKDVRKYDYLVAADGLGSKIRGQILHAEPRDQLFDEGVHVAYFTVKQDMLNGSRLAQWYNATGGRCILLRPDPNPAGRCSVLLQQVTRKGDTALKDRLNQALREGNQSYKALMEELYHDAGWKSPAILKAMHESDDFYCSLFAQTRSPKLQDDRVVLLGDAGYATPGVGTSLAIIGGYVLAGELLRNQDDVPAAFRTYEELMMPFVKEQQGDFPAMQLLNPQTQWGLSIRNSILGTITTLKLDRLAIAVAGWLGFQEKKFPLPDYKWSVQS